jgi:periplasmic copper chaperone A
MKRTAVLFLLFAGFNEAQAHVTLETTQATADSYYKATLRAPHGCKGSPTIRLRVRIPEGVTGVKPQPKPGWTLEITHVKLAKPLDDGHGGKITETVGEVSWSGGPLADEHFDEFQMMMKLPDRPGTTLHFPVVQECKQGVHRWIEIPAAGQSARDLKEPAPALRLMPKK